MSIDKIKYYLKPGAIVPVDMATTKMLVDALLQAIVTEESSETQEPVADLENASFDELLGNYWQIAYAEGKTGESYGDKANEVLFRLRSLYTHQQQKAEQEPNREPLTDEQIVDTFCKAPHQTQYVAWFAAGVRYAEAAHDIKGEA